MGQLISPNFGRAGRPRSSLPVFINIVHINDDLWIAHRADQKRPTWYLLKLGRHWPRRSLKTTDQAQARREALKLYMRYLEDPNGPVMGDGAHSRRQRSFKAVAEAWLATITQDRVNKEATLRKFLLPYFHEVRQVVDIGDITDEMIDDYKLWRRSFWLTQAGQQERERQCRSGVKISVTHGEDRYGEPSANTLNREYPTLRQILGFAGKKGYFGKRPVPAVSAEPAKANPRPAFLGDEFDRLMRESAAWIPEASDERTRWKRQALEDWIVVVRYTGIRPPHEAEKLTWADVRLDIGALMIPDDTKTGRRQVPLLYGEAVDRLRQMRERRETYTQQHGHEFSLQEPVFALPDGSTIAKYGELFNDLVKRCRFERRPDQLPYSPYSLRHTFATHALAEGLSYEMLAKVMGTSEKMLQQHYNQVTVQMVQQFMARRRGETGTGRLMAPPDDPAWAELKLGDPKELDADDPRNRRLLVAP